MHWFGSNAPTLIIEIIDSTPVEMWYTLDGGMHNYTFHFIEVHFYTYVAFAGVVDHSAWESLPEGSVTITFYAIDMAGNEASEDVIITKSIPSDGDDPTIVIVIVVVSIVGGVAAAAVVYIFMKKRVAP